MSTASGQAGREPMAAATRAPLVSVCIANFRGEHLLRDCVDSVLAQQFDGGLEVIVHDDCSDDGSVALLRRDYPQVRVIESETNVGFCVANNRMAQVACGENLLLLNNDAALLPGALAAMLGACMRQPGIYTVPQYDWQDNHLVDKGCDLDLFMNPVPNLMAGDRPVAMVIGACLFLPSALWRELGGFPTWMGSIAEDLYLCGLARLRGFAVEALSTSGYRHRQGHSFGGNRAAGAKLHSTYRRRALSERNKTYALTILTPTALVWPLLALHLMLLAAEGAALCLASLGLKPWTSIYWPAIAAPWKSRPLLAQARRDVQAARRIGVARYFSGARLLPRKVSLLFRFGMPRIS